MVSGENHTVTRCLQPEAQAARPAEQVRCQVRAFGAQPGRIGQELRASSAHSSGWAARRTNGPLTSLTP